MSRLVERRNNPVGVFHVPCCDDCGAWLADEQGQPRWYITSDGRFVCLNGCPPQPQRPAGWRRFRGS